MLASRAIFFLDVNKKKKKKRLISQTFFFKKKIHWRE